MKPRSPPSSRSATRSRRKTSRSARQGALRAPEAEPRRRRGRSARDRSPRGGSRRRGGLIQGSEPVHKITIIPRGMALGATMYLPEKDRLDFSKKRAEATLSVAYGGRVAEEILGDDISAGAANDIARATELARMMVCEWGFSSKVGPLRYVERSGSEFLGTEIGAGRFHSEATAREIDEEVRKVCDARVRAHESRSSRVTATISSGSRARSPAIRDDHGRRAEGAARWAGRSSRFGPRAGGAPRLLPRPKPRPELRPSVGPSALPDAGLAPA